jgi:hypothetical protein
MRARTARTQEVSNPRLKKYRDGLRIFYFGSRLIFNGIIQRPAWYFFFSKMAIGNSVQPRWPTTAVVFPVAAAANFRLRCVFPLSQDEAECHVLSERRQATRS